MNSLKIVNWKIGVENIVVSLVNIMVSLVKLVSLQLLQFYLIFNQDFCWKLHLQKIHIQESSLKGLRTLSFMRNSPQNQLTKKTPTKIPSNSFSLTIKPDNLEQTKVSGPLNSIQLLSYYAIQSNNKKNSFTSNSGNSSIHWEFISFFTI